MAESGAQVRQSYEYEPPLSFWIAREQKLCTDLLLHVGKEEHYRVVDAHRDILVANSLYFKDVLVIDNKEKNYRPEIRIPDMTEKQVLCILKYIYTQIIEAVGMKSLLDTLYGAHRFQIQHLVVKCKRLIEELLQSDSGTSVILIDNHKRLYDEDKYLLDLAKSTLQLNLKTILGSEGIQNVSYDTMEVLLDIYQEEMPETAYFEALDRWAIATCRKKNVEPDAVAKRDIAGTLIEKIYFNELPAQFVAENVQESRLLQENDMLNRSRSTPAKKRLITRKEKHIFLTMDDEKSTDDTEEHLLISMEWFNNWKARIENCKSSNYPGPVVQTDNKGKKDVNFKVLSISSCDYLMSLYGPLPESFEFQAQVGEDLRQGSPVIWEVPQTGRIEIEVAGARGGNHQLILSSVVGGSLPLALLGGLLGGLTFGLIGGALFGAIGYREFVHQGGRGAMMKSEFRVKKGDELSLIVGHRGGDSSEFTDGAGGGGATIVSTVQEPPKPLLIGGGGGGASGWNHGANGVRGENGTDAAGDKTGQPELQGRGGQNGDPGSTGVHEGDLHGGAGAGWNGQGQNRANTRCGGPGCSRQGGWRGGDAGRANPTAVGGYGGGGGGSQAWGCAGAGGGFSGGGAGVKYDYNSGGGSGGSYSAGSNTTGQDGGNQQDHGYIIIKYLDPVTGK